MHRAKVDKASKITIFIRFVIILILVDLLSKVIVYLAMPFQTSIPILGDFLFFHVTLNHLGVNPMVQNLSGNNQLMLVLISLTALLMAVYIYIASRSTVQLKLRIIIGVLIYAILSTVSFEVAEAFPVYTWNNHLVSLFAKVGPVLFFLSLFYIVKSPYLKWSFALIIAGGCGNILSSFYPPFKVIDFIGTAITKDLIFNLADVYSIVAYCAIIVYPLYYLVVERPAKNLQKSTKVGLDNEKQRVPENNVAKDNSKIL